MKKKVIVGVCIVIVVIACFLAIKIYKQNSSVDRGDGYIPPPTPLAKQTVDSIKKEYPEWMEALDITDEKLIGYEGACGYSYSPYDSKHVSLNIYDEEGDYLSELVQKDHAFIKKYPDKFNKNAKRMIYYSYAIMPCERRYGYKNFLDQASEHLDLDIKLDGSMKIGFMLENARIGKITFDNIEVLEIYRDKHSMSSLDHEDRMVYSSFLLDHKINDLKYIVLFDFREFVGESLEAEIKSTYPDVKIYQVNTKDGEKE